MRTACLEAPSDSELSEVVAAWKAQMSGIKAAHEEEVARLRSEKEGQLREAALASGFVDAATFDRVCDPRTMVGHGVAGA
jgi:fumarate hydratase class II